MRKPFMVLVSLLSIFQGAKSAPPENGSQDISRHSRQLPKQKRGIEESDALPIGAAQIAQSMTPLVRKEGNSYKVDPSFVKKARTYAEMEDLSYHLVKGRVELSNNYLEKFMNEGWKITGFGGLSGTRKFDKEKYDAQNADLAGFVAFHPQTNEAVVVFHGSQDSYDWVDNFDSVLVNAKDMGYNFDGKVARGWGTRYNSSRSSIYGILKQIYTNLDDINKDKFNITVTGHSLGGGMVTIGYSDLSTSLAKELWGSDYKNADGNRIRAYAMSPPRALDEEAVDYLSKEVGEHNLIIDANDYDPVSKMGPGKGFTKWLKTSSNYGITRVLLTGAKLFGITEVGTPKAAAEAYGGAKHFGMKAMQDTSKTIAKAKTIPEDPRIQEELKKLPFFKRQFAKANNWVERKLAPYHYGTKQAHGAAFDTRLIEPETLEERINKFYGE
jgi:hypothetical protein